MYRSTTSRILIITGGGCLLCRTYILHTEGIFTWGRYLPRMDIYHWEMDNRGDIYPSGGGVVSSPQIFTFRDNSPLGLVTRAVFPEFTLPLGLGGGGGGGGGNPGINVSVEKF